MRVFVTADDAAGHLKLLDEYLAFLSGWSPSTALDEREPGATPDSRHVLERLSALQRFRGNARLLGLEAFWLFVEYGDLRVALVRENGQQRQLVAALPARSGWLQDTDRTSPLLQVHLGRWGWRLYLRPRHDRSLSPACRTLAALVQSLAADTDSGPEHDAPPDCLPPPHDAGPPAVVFVSESMDAIVRSASRVAPTILPVLITGETGTGKEVLARLVHRRSAVASGPFVAFNCATVPPELLDSQLFGHRRGAFTGAHQDFAGIIRAAEGGTLFLDEIGDLGRNAQPKLLRFLESGELHPLGAARPVTAAVRVIAATNVPLDALVRDGRFRQDILYRLDGARYHLPPLRERREDVPPLVDHFLARYSEEFRKGRVRIADEALEYLLLYWWPGNVRQLANEIRRAVALADPDATLGPECLSAELVPQGAPRRPAAACPTPAGLLVRLDQPLGAATAQLERAMLERALRESGGRVEEAAMRLGVSRKGLYLKRHRLDLNLDAARLRHDEPDA